MDEIAELRAALAECADELEVEIEERYRGLKDHPAMERRYKRDIASVLRARAALATPPQT